MAGGVDFLRRLEDRLRAECGTGIVAGEQGLEFADDLLGGLRDQVGFDFQLEALLEERGFVVNSGNPINLLGFGSVLLSAGSKK